MQSKLKILLLEDNVADAEMVAAALEGCGFAFSIDAIRSEGELRKHMEKEIPDLILSDHGFPSFNGFQALKIVRRTHPDLPFIFVSGSNDQGLVFRMYEQGATDYVYKRDLGDLKSAVLRALEAKRESAPSIRSEPMAAEPELNLQLPVADVKHAYSPGSGRLSFCPRCRRIRDESGRPIEVARHCEEFDETVIHRELCPDCVRPQRPG